MKRCCNLGCTTRKIANEGYQVGFGFMLWACPIHADMWREFDKQNKAYEQYMSDEYAKALNEFEEKWEREFEEKNDRPIPLAYQPSEVE